MVPTFEQLKMVSKTKVTPTVANNIRSVIQGLERFGGHSTVAILAPHRLAQYLAQLAHESGGFKYDKEIWGNTAAQQRYDTRVDLGNTPEKDGDGKLYMGRTGMQLTGKANYAAFTKWAKQLDVNSPDFVSHPELVNTDPWEGLVPLWFWTLGNRTSKSLNIYADQNDIEMITRIVNGGKNGLEDRLDYYTRVGLVLLGYDIATKDKLDTSIRLVQQKAGLEVDGIDGPRTRTAIHNALVDLDKTGIKTTQAPVTETKMVAVPVVPAGVDTPKKDLSAVVVAGVTAAGASPIAKPLLDTFGGLSQAVQLVLVAVAVGALVYLFIGRRLLSSRAKEVIQEAVQHNANNS